MMVADKINLANEMCQDRKKEHFKYNYLYSFATENITGYQEYVDFSGKSVLTVGSSGDQALNAIMGDAKEVTLFDICPFAKEYLALKMAAINYMNKEDYLDFFGYHKRYLFNNFSSFNEIEFYRLLTIVIQDDIDSYRFWMHLLRDNRGRVIRKRLFLKEEYNSDIVKNINPYLSNYDEMRKKLRGKYINVICDDIISHRFNNKYDIINLSNIGVKLDLMFFKKLVDKMMDCLNDDGVLLACYLYDTDMTYTGLESKIYDMKALRKMFEDMEVINFRGINSYCLKLNEITDSMVLIKKKAKNS